MGKDMKGRSNRLQSSDPPEDWVNGSWTVDCVCGVNYDDGEEMVNCDECGVWVHTRCSRYVKGDDIFVCDKCKGKIACNDSEETEVAQLLVELPTKTMRMESNYASNKPPRHPRRLWTEKPMEERVHVQGIPGGEPALFRGLSSVFTPELWKSSGYVPKKFNFHYKEFPCWDEKLETGSKNDEENENPDNNGAGVLFSLSKETVLPTPVATLSDLRRNVEDEACGRKAFLKESNKWEADDINTRQGMEKERTILQPVLLHSGSRKEDIITARDRSGKRKARASDKKDDTKKIISHSAKTVFTLSREEKQSELHEGRGQNNSKIDSQSTKNNILQESVVCGPVLDVPGATDNYLEQSKNIKSPHELSSGVFSSVMYENNLLNGSERMEEKAGSQIPLVVIKSSSKTESPGSSLLERTTAGNFSIKQEGDDAMINVSDDSGGGSSRCVAKVSAQDLSSAKLEVKGSIVLEDFEGDVSLNLAQAKMELQHVRESPNIQSSPGTKKELQILTDQMSENLKVNDAQLCSSQTDGHKMQEVDKGYEAVCDYFTDQADGQSNGPCHYKEELDSSKGFKVVESSSDPLKGSLFAAEQSKSDGTVLNSQPVPNHKIALPVGKSSPVPTTIVVTKSSSSGSIKPVDAPNPTLTSQQRVMSGSSTSSRKESNSSDLIRDDEREEKPRKTIKEQPKPDANSSPKILTSNRTSQDFVSKRSLSGSKDFVVYSSSKASSANIVKANTGSGESKGPQRNQKPLHAHNKIASSGLPQKGEKSNPTHIPASSKVTQNHPYPPVPSNIHANLSDEELALLLHQELNSSPRVPRVPRLRHSGSLPQLANPSATSILIKHSSSSGGKDLGSVSRRKVKDVSKDSNQTCRHTDDEAKKTARVPHSSPDQRKNVASPATDASMKRDDNRSSPRMVVRKNISSASTTASSGPSSSTEVNDRNVSSIRNSPRNTSDEDTGTVGGPVNRTLPGLIDEMLSKDRRLTYEELCNAVLPHWPTLRKHNGDRYAYSNHSQAVLDCLRNRYEWAQLVDRGPKTNSSRKRHKLDADESEDSEQGKGRKTRDVVSKSLDSHKEEFPKGKRKARKRRRLALQGRGVKDLRKRRKNDIGNDEVGQVTISSEESIFSEDEIREGEGCRQGSEASDSSEEAVNL